MSWLLILPTLPRTPSRHRVALWRALRKSGAALVAAGVWTAPDLPAFTEHMPKIHELAHAGGGDLMVLRTLDDGTSGSPSLRAAFVTALQENLMELEHGCARLEAEITDATDVQRFTFVALDALELSLTRLQRQHRTLLALDVVGLVETQHATGRMQEREVAFATLRARVQAVNEVTP